MEALQIVKQNNELYVDSRDVASMVDKQHKHLLRDIENYESAILQSPNLDPANYFIQSTYLGG